MLFLQEESLLLQKDQVQQNIAEVAQKNDSMRHALHEGVQNIHSAEDAFDFFGTAIKTLIEGGIPVVLKLALGILILWLGFMLARRLKKRILATMDKRGVEVSLRGFIASLIDILLKLLIIIMVMDIVGIKVTSFIAILGALGLAVGMALQGTLQNFAGGVIILLMRPFRVGDYIQASGHEGWVSEIRIFNTILRTFDHQSVIIPNTELATATLVNYTKEKYRRVEVKVGLAYGESVEKAREVLTNLADSDPRVINEEKPTRVIVKKLSESSVDLELWTWTTHDQYWNVLFDLTEKVYREFGEQHLKIPFPQVQVHMSQDGK